MVAVCFMRCLPALGAGRLWAAELHGTGVELAPHGLASKGFPLSSLVVRHMALESFRSAEDLDAAILWASQRRPDRSGLFASIGGGVGGRGGGRVRCMGANGRHDDR